VSTAREEMKDQSVDERFVGWLGVAYAEPLEEGRIVALTAADVRFDAGPRNLAVETALASHVTDVREMRLAPTTKLVHVVLPRDPLDGEPAEKKLRQIVLDGGHQDDCLTGTK